MKFYNFCLQPRSKINFNIEFIPLILPPPFIEALTPRLGRPRPTPLASPPLKPAEILLVKVSLWGLEPQGDSLYNLESVYVYGGGESTEHP